MAFVTHKHNGATLGVYELGEKVIIGRRLDCNIVVDDQTISGIHAEIQCQGGVYSVLDKESTNGTKINGERIRSEALKHGDVFSLGVHEFEFSDDLPTDLDKTLKIKKSWIPGVYYTQE